MDIDTELRARASRLGLVTLWPGKDAKKLELINKEDFPLGDVLAGLDIQDSPLRGSFGIIDKQAIQDRLTLVSFLRDNSLVRDFVRKIRLINSLPSAENTFLEEFPYERRSFFWQQLVDFVRLVRESDNPSEPIKQLANRFEKMLSFETVEQAETKKIGTVVQKMAKLEGVLRFPLRTQFVGRSTKLHVDEHLGSKERDRLVSLVGFRRYGKFISRQADMNKLRDLRMKWYNPVLWGLHVWSLLTIAIRKKVAQRASVVSDQRDGGCLNNDIAKDLNTHLHKVPIGNLNVEGVFLYVAFTYGPGGLRYRVSGLRREISDDDEKAHFPFDFGGFTRRQKKVYRKALRRRQAWESALKNEIQCGRFLQAIGKKWSGFDVTGDVISSPQSDMEYKWSAIVGIYNLDEHLKVTQKMLAYRAYFAYHLSELLNVVRLIDSIEKHAREQGVPACVPQLVDGHTVRGEGLIPVQLMFRDGRRQKLVPMRGMPELNGQMLGITGAHGGGKTELLHAIPVNIYLAQSGLLVLGESFEFNPKKAIGLLFITQKGVGSTIQLILKKVKKITRGIKPYKPHEVVVVLDELGTATQEHGGELFGLRLLATFFEKGVSVIYSTQILSIPERAATDFGAINYQLDAQHRISPGIGDGGLDELVRKSGLNRDLVQLNN